MTNLTYDKFPKSLKVKYSINGGTSILYSTDIKADLVTQDIVFNLYDGGTLIDSEKIPVVRDGKKGDTGPTGPPGPAGSSGSLGIRMCGKWDSSKYYCCKWETDENGAYLAANKLSDVKYTDVVWITNSQGD
jgi:hypothetical protein